jgi:hypothetical protein
MAAMTLQEFSAESQGFWNKYLATIADRIARSIMRLSDAYTAYYPTAILITEMPHHLAMELVGYSQQQCPLRATNHKVESTDSYLGTFLSGETSVRINLLGNGDITCGVAFVSPRSVDALGLRFPGILGKFPFHMNWDGDPDAIPLRIAEGAGFVQFDESLIVNSYRGAVRIRYMNLSIVSGKQKSLDEYRSFLREKFALVDGTPARGVRIFNRADDYSIHVAAQFANVFLMNQLRETTIGSYIDQNRELLLQALGGTDLVSEPYLTWEIASPDPEEHAINPDLFVRSRDGFWDVYDLKLPFLERDSITTGERRRRRFITLVEDGIAQLAHYREFLSHEAHRRQARAIYGVEFRENPLFGLVVGNFENVHRVEVDEAMRRLARFELFDYDTLTHLYLAQNGAFPAGL